MEKWALPYGWEWVNLSTLIDELESGRRPKGGVKGIFTGIPSISGEHMTKDGGFEFSKLRYVPEKFAETLNQGWIKPGDILIVKDGATTGKASFIDNSFPFPKAVINEHVFRLQADSNKILQKFLFYFLFSIMGQQMILSSYRGAAVGGINRNFVQGVNIPLPFPNDLERSFTEQHRIVAQVQGLLSDVRDAVKLSNAISNDINNLPASIFDHLLDKDVQYASFEGFLSEGMRNGANISLDSKGGEGITFAKVGIVNSGKMDPAEVKKVDMELDNDSPYWMKQNDIFVSRGNTIDLVGRAAVYEGYPQECAYPDLLIRVRVDPQKANPHFIAQYFHSNHARQYIESVATGTSASMKKISQQKLREMPIPNISLNEQDNIAIYIDKVNQEVNSIRSGQKQTDLLLDQLETTILVQTFHGES